MKKRRASMLTQGPDPGYYVEAGYVNGPLEKWVAKRTFRVTPEQMEKLIEQSKKEGIPLAILVNRIILDYMPKVSAERAQPTEGS